MERRVPVATLAGESSCLGEKDVGETMTGQRTGGRITERRTAPQTISVAPKPPKPVDPLAQFKAYLRTQTTSEIMGVLADKDLMNSAPPGAREAAKDELRRRAADPDQSEATAKEALGAMPWSGLQKALRRVKGTPAEDVVMAEVRRRARSGKFGPRSQ